jgi:hypothetical protein
VLDGSTTLHVIFVSPATVAALLQAREIVRVLPLLRMPTIGRPA